MTKRADDNNVRGIAKPDPLHLYGPGVAMLVTGLLVSGLVFLALRTAEVADSQQQFSILSGERRDLLQKQVDSHLQVLAGVRALFDSSEFVSAQEFDLHAAIYRTLPAHACAGMDTARNRRAARSIRSDCKP